MPTPIQPPDASPVTIPQMTAQAVALGVRRGGVLLVHTSFRAVRPVENGPAGLIAALRDALGPEGTLVMPTMTDGSSVFDPRTTPTHEMGITAETFWRQPGVVRSGHPGGSFAAVGPLAEHLCAPQALSPPHGPDSPPGRVRAANGQILLLGVEHSENTTLHVAEAIAGVPYAVQHPCVVAIDGEPREILIVESDHCCRGFLQMNAWLDERGLQRAGRIGHASAILVDADDVVAVATAQLARDPLVFLCPSGACEECDAARASVGIPRATV